MSHSEKKETKKKADITSVLLAVVLPFVVLGPIGFGLWEDCGQHVYGTTPEDLETVSLSATPKQLGHALKQTSVHDTVVVAKFKTSAGKGYEKATFSWDKSDLSAPKQIDLSAERELENRDEVRAALTRRLNGTHSGSFAWGHTSFSQSGSHGDVSFTIDSGHKGNPLFDRQLEAGREVLLNVAFGTPIQVSDRELADVLGAGYPTADIAKLDTSVSIEDAGDAVRKLFPGALSSRRDDYEIAIDHPLFYKVHFSWRNEPRGKLQSFDLTNTDAYKASRPLLATCLTQKLGAPRERVVDYAAGTAEQTFKIGTLTLTLGTSRGSVNVGSIDAASIAQLFTALDGCRDANETATTSRSEKK